MGLTEALIAWIQNMTEIKRKLSKSGKTDSTLGQYYHINMWKTDQTDLWLFPFGDVCQK